MASFRPLLFEAALVSSHRGQLQEALESNWYATLLKFGYPQARVDAKLAVMRAGL